MFVFVLGNGFSIDLIKLMEKEHLLQTGLIDLENLFAEGDSFSISSCQQGYLSHCNSLKAQGVSTAISKEESKKLIDKFITSYNIYARWRTNNPDQLVRMGIGNKYIELYNELIDYLKKLFLHYNQLVSDDALQKLVQDEKVPVISLIKKAIASHEHIKIITYNYDVFLERLLDVAKIPYVISGFEEVRQNIEIFKPHGSISFDVKCARKYSIWEGLSLNISCLKVTKNLNGNYDLCAIIPPYGDANLSTYNWCRSIRDNILRLKLSNCDKIILFGISYGEIDRPEIDSILLKAQEETGIWYINPKPSEQLCFILESLFKNYNHYDSLNERN